MQLQPHSHMCDRVRTYPHPPTPPTPQSHRRNEGNDRNVCRRRERLFLFRKGEKREKKKRLHFCNTSVRSDCYRHVVLRWTMTNTHTQAGSMIEKLQKAIMIVRMCRDVVFAAANIVNRAALGDLLLHRGTWRGSPWPPSDPSKAHTHQLVYTSTVCRDINTQTHR